ncbi:MAG: response regulator [candidate division WOR-3 bacterium]|nr:MAG: response regulator [candidate division WOR-3 bacterium]
MKARTSNNHNTILIIDDSPTILQLLRLSLEKETDFKIYTAQSPEDAFDTLASLDIHLVICDIMLKSPNAKGGYHLLKKIKGSPEYAHIPVILMSGTRTNRMAQTTAHHLGADAFLKKPFQNEELIACVRRALRGS